MAALPPPPHPTSAPATGIGSGVVGAGGIGAGGLAAAPLFTDGADVPAAPASHRSAMYRSEDPISNLRIEVRLRCVRAAPAMFDTSGSGSGSGTAAPATAAPASDMIPLVARRPSTGAAAAAAAAAGQPGESDEGQGAPVHAGEVKTVVIAWQQKIYGQREINELLKRENRTGFPTRGETIFTYVDEDNYFDADDVERSVVTGESGPTHLPRLIAAAAHQGGRHSFQRPYKSMYILCMVDEQGEESGWSGRERLLCALRAYDDGRIVIRPDFSPDDRRPYTFTTPRGAVYEYTLSNASEMRDVAAIAADHTTQLQLAKRAQDLRATVVGTTFDEAPREHTDVLVLGAIHSASGFDTTALYVRYVVLRPDGWQWRGGPAEQEEGVTQISQPRADRHPGRVGPSPKLFAFAHPLQLRFAATDLNTSPCIVLQACSCDYWDRHRTHGYAYVQLPLVCGQHVLRVTAWEPLGTVQQKLSAFFVGGSPELEDVAYTAVPRDLAGQKVLNKYGFRTRTSGDITLHLNIVMQSAQVRRAGAPGAPVQSTMATRASEIFSALARKKAMERVASRMAERAKKTS